MIWRGLLVGAAVAGCGRVGFDAAADGSPASPTDAIAQQCATIAALADDYTTNITAPGWTVTIDPLITVTRGGGELEIALAPDDTTTAYGTFVSSAAYDLREHCVVVSALEIPRAAPQSEMVLAIDDGTVEAGQLVVGGNLSAYTTESSTVTLHTQVPFDPLAHHRWRLRETGGRLFWETSPDGLTWHDDLDLADPLDVSHVTIQIHAGTFASTATPGRAVFTDFDLGPGR